MANLEGSALILLSGCWVVNGFLLNTSAMSSHFKVWTFIEQHLSVCKCVLWVVDRKQRSKKENSSIECQKPLQWKLLLSWETRPERVSGKHLHFTEAGWTFREKNLTTQDHWKNGPVATFMQDDIMLVFAPFVTLSKWYVQWVVLKTPYSFIQNGWTWFWQCFHT